MNGSLQDFWGLVLQAAALIGAAIMRIVLSPWEGQVRALISFAVAVFCGVFLPDPTLAFLHSWLHIEPEDYRTLTIILWALSGEGIVKFVLTTVKTPKTFGDMLIRVVAAFRGKSE